MVSFLVLLTTWTFLPGELSASDITWPSENKVRIRVDWPGPSVDKEHEENGQVLFMTSADQERYKCILPKIIDDGKQEDSSSEYKGQSPLELLKPIFSQLLCALKIDSFWVYELCHGYYFRQFHEEKTPTGKVHLEYILGKFDVDAALLEEKKKGLGTAALDLPTIQVEDAQLPYYEINMTDGTFCELNGRKRYTRVLYVCHMKGSTGIFSMKESPSCEYEVVVLTSLLCTHPAFSRKYYSEKTVYCHPVDDSSAKPKRLVKLLEDAKKPETFKPFLGTATLEKDVAKHVATLKISKPKKDFTHDEKLIEDLLHGRYCLRGGTGWWRYEFCYGKQIKQYHINDDGSKTSVLLGTWNIEKHLKWLEDHPSKKPKKLENLKQVSHFYSEGEFCDEAKKKRVAEVKLRCKDNLGHPDSVSLYLMEPKTCEYVLMVESPVFCSMFAKVDENGLTPQLH